MADDGERLNAITAAFRDAGLELRRTFEVASRNAPAAAGA